MKVISFNGIELIYSTEHHTYTHNYETMIWTNTDGAIGTFNAETGTYTFEDEPLSNLPSYEAKLLLEYYKKYLQLTEVDKQLIKLGYPYEEKN